MRAGKKPLQWVKVFAVTHSIPVTPMVEGENRHLKLSSDLHTCAFPTPQIQVLLSPP